MNNNDFLYIQKCQLEAKIQFFKIFSFLGKILLVFAFLFILLSLGFSFSKLPNDLTLLGKIIEFVKMINIYIIMFYIIILFPPLGIIFLGKRSIARIKNNIKELKVSIN